MSELIGEEQWGRRTLIVLQKRVQDQVDPDLAFETIHGFYSHITSGVVAQRISGPSKNSNTTRFFHDTEYVFRAPNSANLMKDKG